MLTPQEMEELKQRVLKLVDDSVAVSSGQGLDYSSLRARMTGCASEEVMEAVIDLALRGQIDVEARPVEGKPNVIMLFLAEHAGFRMKRQFLVAPESPPPGPGVAWTIVVSRSPHRRAHASTLTVIDGAPGLGSIYQALQVTHEGSMLTMFLRDRTIRWEIIREDL